MSTKAMYAAALVLNKLLQEHVPLDHFAEAKAAYDGLIAALRPAVEAGHIRSAIGGVDLPDGGQKK